MPDWEKVFDAIRNCITEPKCRDCPWDDCERFDCKRVDVPVSLLLDVLKLLKEQEAETEKLRRYVNGFSRDAIPVVRCKDCKWNSGTHDFPYCQMQNVPISPDWFCAGGERTEKLDG